MTPVHCRRATKWRIKVEENKTTAKEDTEQSEVKCESKKKCKRADTECEALKQRIAELEAQIKEKDDSHLRMAAEYENFRRRTKEEKDSIYGTAAADTVAEFLPLLDNLDRAAAYDDGDKVRDGLRMICSTTGAILTKLGVESFGAPGDRFDPNLHNAIMHDEDDSGKENEITDVFQKGYKKGNRIIRFAMVKTVN